MSQQEARASAVQSQRRALTDQAEGRTWVGRSTAQRALPEAPGEYRDSPSIPTPTLRSVSWFRPSPIPGYAVGVVSQVSLMLCLMLDLQVDVELGVTSSADLFARLRDGEREVSRIRARQVRLLRELMRRRSFSQSALSFSEVTAELDVSTDTARALLETAVRSPEQSERMARLEGGEWSFDRAAAMARLFAAGADDTTMHAADCRDIGGVHKLGALTRRIRRRDERQAHEERHLRCSLSLDESVGFIHGQLGGHDWQIVDRALDERVDQFPKEARVWSRSQRRADALVAIAQDSLNRTLNREPGEGTSTLGPVVTVMVEAATAAETGGEAGVAISGGPRWVLTRWIGSCAKAQLR